MEIFIPSLVVLLFAGITVFAIIPRFTPLVIAVISLILLAFAAYQHSIMFFPDYRLTTWAEGARSGAPFVMVAVSILIVIGQILAFMGEKRNNGSEARSFSVPGSIPPPETATNFVTRGIGNGLLATGAVNESRSTSSSFSGNRSRSGNSSLSRLI